MFTDYTQYDTDEVKDLFDDFANARMDDSVAYYESEDVFELKARQRELDEA